MTWKDKREKLRNKQVKKTELTEEGSKIVELQREKQRKEQEKQHFTIRL